MSLLPSLQDIPRPTPRRAPPAAVTVPRRLNIGSGRSFRPDCLNVDVSPYWQPDIVADLNAQFPAGDRSYETDRFGRIVLEPGSFDEIIAIDVLEHVRELQVVMESCLDLLREGGVFCIYVPHELSLGAWSDPTHVRAFNERSWVYWTEWVWYFGWTEHRYQLGHFQAIANEYGLALEAEGRSVQEILRTPRAIDAMYVELVKARMTDEQRDFVRQQAAREPGSGPMPVPG